MTSNEDRKSRLGCLLALATPLLVFVLNWAHTKWLLAHAAEALREAPLAELSDSALLSRVGTDNEQLQQMVKHVETELSWNLLTNDESDCRSRSTDVLSAYVQRTITDRYASEPHPWPCWCPDTLTVCDRAATSRLQAYYERRRMLYLGSVRTLLSTVPVPTGFDPVPREAPDMGCRWLA
jgi:hypothetical protein